MWHAVLACAGLAVAQTPPPPKPAAAPAVEYRYTSVDFGHAFMPLRDRLAKLADSLTRLGADGWEVVSLHRTLEGPVAGGGEPRNFFKRPVAAERRSKWEYRIVDLAGFGLNRSLPREPANARENVLQRLRDESADGWELVETFTDSGVSRVEQYFLLKRAKR